MRTRKIQILFFVSALSRAERGAMKIQKMSDEQVLEVAKLYAQVFGEVPWNETWSLEDALEAVNNPVLIWYVATDPDGAVIGFVAGCIANANTVAHKFQIPEERLGTGLVGYKAELGVLPSYRRTGLARRLSNELINTFREAGVDQFLVRTRPGTGNFPWYQGKLSTIYRYDDGRELFGCQGLPLL